MPASSRRKLLQRGDTIIEVLIAMAVVSSVLAISYATMNRNLLTIQDSQERTQAAKLVQGQIESVRQAHNTGAPVLSSHSKFCIAGDGTVKDLTGSSPTATVQAEPADWSTYANCSFGLSNLYHIAITTSDHANYKFYIRWDRIGNGTRDEIIMVYKVN